MNSRPPSRIPWPPLLYIIAAAAAMGMARFSPLAPAIPDLPMRGTGFILFSLGLAADLSAVVTLRKAKTTIRPDRAAIALVTSGPFAWSRNPIYLGNTIMLCGAAIATFNVWFLVFGCLAAVLTLQLAIIPEEHHLTALFGDLYLSYQRRTGRWFGRRRLSEDKIAR